MGRFWVNFTNVIWAAFKCADPKSAKGHWLLDYLVEHLGSQSVKAVSKHVGVIDPWWCDAVWATLSSN